MKNMNNIVKLETLVHKFVKEYDNLRMERNNITGNSKDIEIKLEKAKETINELKQNYENFDRMENTSESNIENKKSEIIKQIKFIIARIDGLNFGNVTDV